MNFFPLMISLSLVNIFEETISFGNNRYLRRNLTDDEVRSVSIQRHLCELFHAHEAPLRDLQVPRATRISAGYSVSGSDISRENIGAASDSVSAQVDSGIRRLHAKPDFLERVWNAAAHTLHVERCRRHQAPVQQLLQPIDLGS
jgi:hypothetical protein